MPQSKKLIEVAMPVKEIMAESVRDKSNRHGHISTLHLWWAQRPLPVFRTAVFSSSVPDTPNDSLRNRLQIFIRKFYFESSLILTQIPSL